MGTNLNWLFQRSEGRRQKSAETILAFAEAEKSTKIAAGEQLEAVW